MLGISEKKQVAFINHGVGNLSTAISSGASQVTLVELAETIQSKWGRKPNLIDYRGGERVVFKGGEGPVIGIGDRLAPDKILELILMDGIQHLVQTEGYEFEKELETSCKMAFDRRNFMDFPISSVLQPEHASQRTEQSYCLMDVSFSGAFHKNKILTDLRSAVDPLCKSGSIKNEVLTIADELITNAIFNAPFVDELNSNAGINREDDSTCMNEGRAGRVVLGSDGVRVFLGCHDPYGSLNMRALFERIHRVYQTGVANNINMGTGGAGIGSYMIFNASVSYYAVVYRGQLTMICCTVPLKMSSRQRSECPKNVHYVTMQEAP